MRIQRALVTGAGIGGLAAATALAQRGVDVDVVAVPPNIGEVASNLPANALRVLRSLGVLDECEELGFRYDRNEFYDWHGNLLVSCPSKLGVGVPSYLGMRRTDLHRVLTTAAEVAGAKITTEVRLRDLVDHGERVEVTLTDGRMHDYGLVVGFEGIHSPLRRRLLGERGEPVFTGYAVWRLMTERCPEVTSARFFQGDGTRAGVIPTGENHMCLLHVTPEPGNPPHAPADYPELLAERLHGYRGPIGRLREHVRHAEGIVHTPLMDVPLPPSWYRGRVIVLGGAVHGCAPHAILGTGMSLEDAVVLAEGVETGEPLPSFMWRRFDRVQLARDSSRAVLFTEIAAPAPHAAQRLRRALPDQLAAVETFLNQQY